MPDNTPPQGLVDGVAALQRKMMPTADVSDQVARQCDITFHFGAKDSPVIVGDHCYIRTSFPGRISGWAIMADPAGSVSFTVKACSLADYLTSSANLVSIVAAAPPAMTSDHGAEGSIPEVSTWTDIIPRNWAFDAIVDSVSGGIEVLTLAVRAKRLDL